MPITHQAEKKLRRDRKRTTENYRVRAKLRQTIKAARKSPTKKTLSVAFTALDKAAKQHIIHQNKAARLKSRLSALTKKK